jgi:hypothetical protein
MQQPTVQISPNSPVISLDQSAGVLTARDVQGLRRKLNDLRNELQDAASRRQNISGQLPSADSKSRPGLEDRLGILDARIVALEKDITATGELLRSAPPAAFASTLEPGEAEAARIANRVANDLVPIVAILSIFVFLPFTLAIARFIWRRSTPAARHIQPDHATQQRLEQLQHSMDTIAIEVERISEGQRFVTKIMSERALGAGAAEPARPGMKSAIPAERG